MDWTDTLEARKLWIILRRRQGEEDTGSPLPRAAHPDGRRQDGVRPPMRDPDVRPARPPAPHSRQRSPQLGAYPSASFIDGPGYSLLLGVAIAGFTIAAILLGALVWTFNAYGAGYHSGDGYLAPPFIFRY